MICAVNWLGTVKGEEVVGQTEVELDRALWAENLQVEVPKHVVLTDMTQCWIVNRF